MIDTLKAIASQGAWTTPGRIAEITKTDESEVADTLAELDVDGLIRVRQNKDGLAVTLTIKGAEQVGMQLVDDGELGVRWAGDNDPVRDESGRVDIRHLGHPIPQVLLGLSYLWHNKPFQVCPVCKGLPMSGEVYCLFCNRWGHDQDTQGNSSQATDHPILQSAPSD